MKQYNWELEKSHISHYWPTVRSLLCLFLHLGIWNLAKSSLVWKPIISNPFRCPYPNSHLNTLSRLYVALQLWKLPQSTERPRVTRKRVP